LNPWQIDYSKPFYEIMRSPAAEKLSVTFFTVDWQRKRDFDNDPKIVTVEMPDGSRIYMHADYNDADRKYIARQFWDQRWSRYADAARIVALWALVPCVILFILGYAVLWVGRGFSRA
jgi:hypothetical protein